MLSLKMFVSVSPQLCKGHEGDSDKTTEKVKMRIQFLGGAGTVTGSKYLLEAGSHRVLVDCGLFQGYKQLRLLNWKALPVDPATIDAVVLTHAHLDHSGYLPVLVRNGFRGPIYSTSATRDLCEILLRDCAYLFERDAEFANRHKFSKHHPAKPLYTQAEADKAIKQFTPLEFEQSHAVADGLSLKLSHSGHILGSSFVRFEVDGESVLFSGDLGRPDNPTLPDPAIVRSADHLVIESTYGNREHDNSDPEEVLAEIIKRTAARGGSVIIPSFAVGRSQAILYHLYRLKAANKIPDLPVFLDSPMAINASEIFCKHAKDNRLTEAECRAACNIAKYVRHHEESKMLDQNPVPMVLISASGMATGGRIIHHLKIFAPDPRNCILFTGFQAGGTRGAAMVSGAQEIKIHGQYVKVKAEVQNLHMLSAHADANEIMAWLGHFDSAPRNTFITHGEPDAADALRHRIEEDLNWSCHVPTLGEACEMGSGEFG